MLGIKAGVVTCRDGISSACRINASVHHLSMHKEPACSSMVCGHTVGEKFVSSSKHACFPFCFIVNITPKTPTCTHCHETILNIPNIHTY
jgi:hypothetical protein